jgi:hypothetical protein
MAHLNAWREERAVTGPKMVWSHREVEAGWREWKWMEGAEAGPAAMKQMEAEPMGLEPMRHHEPYWTEAMEQ